MQDLNDKLTGGSLSATEWNQVPSEIQNVIEGTGQTLSNVDLNQLGKGVASYSANGNFYTDSGAADAYVLSPSSLKQGVSAYEAGMRFVFLAGSQNTGASTVNINGLGVKSIKNSDGSALPAGYIRTDVDTEIEYNGVDFILATSALSTESFGVNMSVHDALASRGFTTVFTNPSATKGMMVEITIDCTLSPSTFNLNVGGITKDRATGNSSWDVGLSAYVGPNETYQLVAAVGTGTILTWSERR